MRNLKEYPVTLEEIEKCLRDLGEEIDKKELVGDMRSLLLEAAAQIISRAKAHGMDVNWRGGVYETRTGEW